MAIVCSAPGCSAKKDSTSEKANILFHRFPFRKPDILAKWVDAMKKPSFKPRMKSYLCSAHFTSDDYETRPNCIGKVLKSDAVPSVFVKKRPGRKKKIVIENEKRDEGKDNPDENIIKQEVEELIEEEYLDINPNERDETEIITSQDKETLQILIVDEDGKITNSEYLINKDLSSDDDSKQKSNLLNGRRIKIGELDDESKNRRKEKYWDEKHNESPENSVLSFTDVMNYEQIARLETALLSARKKVKTLEVKCKKMNKKLNRLKILLRLLVVKRGRGEKNLRELLEEYEKDPKNTKVKTEEEDTTDL